MNDKKRFFALWDNAEELAKVFPLESVKLGRWVGTQKDFKITIVSNSPGSYHYAAFIGEEKFTGSNYKTKEEALTIGIFKWLLR